MQNPGVNHVTMTKQSRSVLRMLYPLNRLLFLILIVISNHNMDIYRLSRGYKMIQLLKDEKRLGTLSIPFFESTKGTQQFEQDLTLQRKLLFEDFKYLERVKDDKYIDAYQPIFEGDYNKSQNVIQEKTFVNKKCRSRKQRTNYCESNYMDDSDNEPFTCNDTDDEYLPSLCSSSSSSDDENIQDTIEDKCEYNIKDTIEASSVPVDKCEYNMKKVLETVKGNYNKRSQNSIGEGAFESEKYITRNQETEYCETNDMDDGDNELFTCNDDKYLPSHCSSSSYSNKSKYKMKEALETVECHNIDKNQQQFVPESTFISARHFNASKSRSMGCASVEITNNKITNNRQQKIVPVSTPNLTHTKIFYCIFCKKSVKRFGRHLLTIHKKEPEVINILRYPTKHPERNKMITCLRNQGTFNYNNDNCLNTGDLIVSRRPSVMKKRNAGDYSPCPKCYAYFVAENLYRHYRRCSKNSSTEKQSIKKYSTQLQFELDYKHLKLHPNISLIFESMKNDYITEAIKNDPLLCRVASYLCSKYQTEKHLKNYVRQKLRQLARLYITIKRIQPDIIDFKECLQPKYFDIVIEAVQLLCELDKNTGVHKLPSLANHLEIYLRECVNVLHSMCIIEGNDSRKRLVEDFRNLLKFQFGAAISRSARKTVEETKWNKPKLLPIISDIKLFKDSLIKKAKIYCKRLHEEEFSYIDWKLLVEITSALVLIFNRKRPGETQRILLENYMAKQTVETNSDEYKTLSTLEQALCNTFKRVEIRGKMGRRVPILLRKNHIFFIDTFLKYRSLAGVSQSNIYLFGFDDNKHVRITDILRRESVLCNAKQPQLLRATYLRKQVATTSQLLDLNENEMQMLADFMGHDLEIHKSHYRTPEITLQIAKLSKLLIAVDSGELSDYKNKNFETIEIDKFFSHENDTFEFSSTNNEAANTVTEETYLTGSKSLTNSKVVVCNDVNLDKSEKEEMLEATKKNQENEYNHLIQSNSPNNFEVHENAECEYQTPKRNLKYNSCRFKLSVSPINKQSDREHNTKRRKSIFEMRNDMTPKKKLLKKGNKIQRLTWRTPEKIITRKLFKIYLDNFSLPSEKTVQALTKNEFRLRRRTPAQIKAWINNENKRKIREQDFLE